MLLTKVSRRLKKIRKAEFKKRAYQFSADLTYASPVIILGTQKSGTTAIAALLAELTGRSVTLDVVRAIQHPEWKILLRYGIGSFEEYIYKYKKEFSREIIKEPTMTYFYDEIRAIFPNAKFVMVQRNPFDNIRSILNRLKLPGNLESVNFSDYPELANSTAWRINLDSTWLGHVPLNYIDALAFRWKLAARIYLNNQDGMLLLKYEDFIADKVSKIEGLADRLGLEKTHDVSGSVDRQYQRKGDSSIDLDEFFGDNYSIIYRMCHQEAELLGYKL